jgi:hypothetical protein
MSARKGAAGIAMFIGVGATTISASAAICQTTNSRQCWAIPSNANYSQLAVGRTPAGTGIACAVKTNNSSSWGGILHCFAAAFGSSSFKLMGRGGEESGQNPSWFQSANPSKRIVSLAIEPGPTSNQVIIHALRSDGLTFNAPTIWPKADGANPGIFFAPDIQTPPPNPRTIAFVSGYGNVLTTSTSEQYLQSGFQWQLVSGNLVFVAGNQVDGQSMALFGTSSTSVSIVPFTGTMAPPSISSARLALSLVVVMNPPNPNGPLDTNTSFWTGFGRSTPMGIGQRDAWAALDRNVGTMCSGLTPCIVHSTRNLNGSWAGWTAAFTGNDASFAEASTVQDGAPMRGARGEIWTIYGPQRLAFYAP